MPRSQQQEASLKPRVLVVGSVNLDLIVRCRRVPRAGETVHGEDLQTAPGGKGGNQAVACSRLGAETALVGRVGDDEFGAKLRDGLAADGVNVEAVRVCPGASSGTALILLEEAGDNRIVVMAGANWLLAEDDVAVAAELLPHVDAVMMPLEMPIEVVTGVAAAARARGVRCVLDAGPVTPAACEAGLPAMVDLISPNETEAEALTGIEVREMSDARRAAARLREMGAADVVLKLGARGAYWSGPGGEEHFPAFAVEPVDTTAAGDAFSACLTVGLASGLDMAKAIARANAAGALACLKLGAQPSMPTAQAVETFLQERRG